jgi:hypothetical protein
MSVFIRCKIALALLSIAQSGGKHAIIRLKKVAHPIIPRSIALLGIAAHFSDNLSRRDSQF